MFKMLGLSAALIVGAGGNAFAVSEVVKQACKADYVQYCSQHKIGTDGLRACMRSHRKMLLDRCIKALGSSDEVTEQDIRDYKREMKRE